MNNLSSDKKPDILFSLILGLIPAYLFHLTYSPSNVLIEDALYIPTSAKFPTF